MCKFCYIYLRFMSIYLFSDKICKKNGISEKLQNKKVTFSYLFQLVISYFSHNFIN